MMRKSQLSRLILKQLQTTLISTAKHLPSPHLPTPTPFPSSVFNSQFKNRSFSTDGIIQQLLAELERERNKEREERKRAGLDTADIDAEDEEDFLGVGPLIEKLEKGREKKDTGDLNMYEEPTDSESEDDERFAPDAVRKRAELFEKKCTRHEDLLEKFTDAETLDEAYKWMNRIDKFEQKHFKLRPEYRVIGELMNRMKESTGKNRFLLQQKLNRAIRLVEWKEAYDPNNPANYGVIQHEQVGPSVDLLEHAGFEKEKQIIQGRLDEDANDEFNDMKEKDDMLLEKLNGIDKILEKKLAELDHTFGKKGKVLEEEIRDLAEERNELAEKKRRPLYRKGFDVKLIDVNRTCKVTKGGQVVKYTAMLACGNYHGIVGFAKAKGPAVPIALQKAYEKCFQNLHYVERHEEHTIAHAVQTSYKKTKVYLWPAPTTTGMKAGRTVQTILHLAGFKNVKSKVVGSRNPHNTVKALFKALNAIETPKDVQEKFGRTVVESYLLPVLSAPFMFITECFNVIQALSCSLCLLSSYVKPCLVVVAAQSPASYRLIADYSLDRLPAPLFAPRNVLHFINLFQDRSIIHGVATPTKSINFILRGLPCSRGETIDRKILKVGEELWKETIPLQMGSRLYQLEGLKSNTSYEVKISYPASVCSDERERERERRRTVLHHHRGEKKKIDDKGYELPISSLCVQRRLQVQHPFADLPHCYYVEQNKRQRRRRHDHTGHSSISLLFVKC
ncbi:hypothetical protein Vadar_000365 [Vaccinium darrowii]|uniref:Uncharacterized protein n=1 Tax=Vaccinium darrowii TaxID=229202 RepID=A0ACB7XM83_9ERIC|nr:hypothetical protein Vadar_000365 [Vaccinium darrowii]